MGKKREKSLKQELNHIFFVSSIVPVLAAVIITLFFLNRYFISEYKDRTMRNLQGLGNQIDSYVDRAELTFYQYLFNDNISRFFNYVNNTEIDDRKYQTDSEYHVRSYKFREAFMANSIFMNKYVEKIGFVPFNHNQNFLFEISTYNTRVDRLPLTKEEQEFVQLIADSDLGSIVINDRKMGIIYSEEGFILARRMNKVDQGKHLGYLFITVSENYFQSLISDFAVESGVIVVINYPDGTLAYQYSEDELDIPEDQEFSEVQENDLIKINGKSYLVLSSETKYGFTTMYLIPIGVVTKYFSSVLIVALAFGAAFMIAYVLFCHLFRKIRLQVTEILEFAEKFPLESGIVLSELKPQRISELNKISHALYGMCARTQKLINEKYLLTIEQQKAEYRALQAEINPHFLNNVLSSFIALNRMKETQKLEKMMLSFSKIFRYSCYPDYDSTIKKECDFLNSYLSLEKLRFEEYMEYHIEVEDAVAGVIIPNMLLQPLVENAVKYGFEKERKIEILIRAVKFQERGKEYIWICVANSGKKIDIKTALHTKGVGIRNVRERLYLSYPESFFWFSEQGKYTTVCNLMFCYMGEMNLEKDKNFDCG